MLIEFQYKDKYTHGNWSRQSCDVPSIDECKKIYGLGIDCDYEILTINGKPVQNIKTNV